MKSTLLSFREFHNLAEEMIAEALSITLQEYKELESGTITIDTNLAMKISDLYNAPPQIFRFNLPDISSITFAHCHFTNSNGYVNHLYNEYEIKAREETIQLLKAEIERLREQNDSLLSRLIDG